MSEKTYADQVKLKAYTRRKYANRYSVLRSRAITMLGGQCTNCGISDMRVVQIDQVITVGKNRPILKALLISIGNGSIDTSNLQVLCANCHMIKTSAERSIVPPLSADSFDPSQVSLCPGCNQMTHTVDGKCGKCGAKDWGHHVDKGDGATHFKGDDCVPTKTENEK